MLSPRPNPGQAATHRSPVTLQDLLDDLLWPQLLRSWKLALAPGRVALCFLFVAFSGAVVSVYHGLAKSNVFGELLNGKDAERTGVIEDLRSIVGVFGKSGPEGAAESAYHLFIHTPAQLVTEHWVAALILLPLILLFWCAVGGAVCRSCACEVSLRAALPWRRAVGFGVKKSLALFAALAGPLVLVWIACLVLKLFGLIFFTSNVMGIAGAVLFIVPLVLCLVMATACVAYVLAHSLLIPAVACEGTDSFDAVQRCYAYVLARPGRIVGYILISLLATIPAVVVVIMIAMFAVLMALLITGAPLDNPGIFQGVAKGGYPFTRTVVELWIGLIAMGCVSYFISLYFCAATNLYLVVRRLVDGQDITELWMPPSAPAATDSTIQTPPPPVLPIPDKADYT